MARGAIKENSKLLKQRLNKYILKWQRKNKRGCSRRMERGPSVEYTIKHLELVGFGGGKNVMCELDCFN